MENYTDEQLREELERRGYATRNLLTKADFEFAMNKVNKFYKIDFKVEDFNWEWTMEQALSDKSLIRKIMRTIVEHIAIHTINYNNGN